MPLASIGADLDITTLLVAVLACFGLLGKRLNRLEDDNREMRGRISQLEASQPKKEES